MMKLPMLRCSTMGENPTKAEPPCLSYLPFQCSKDVGCMCVRVATSSPADHPFFDLPLGTAG
eukprot:9200885-Pyramimonas_sp.AAC.1